MLDAVARHPRAATVSVVLTTGTVSVVLAAGGVPAHRPPCTWAGQTIRYAASLRRERGLANAPLAFVTGVGWCPPGVLTFLVRDVLVLVNTTQEAVVLPAGAKVLLSSHMLDRSDGILRVPPTTTVWLRSSTVR